MPVRSVPAGTVTFLFTDIEGSMRLWEAHPETMRTSLARHDALMREAIASANGVVFKTVGDAFCAAFATAAEALEATLAAQLALSREPWPEETPIRVRMALHTGSVESRDDDYFGQPVNWVARLLSTAHGGQSLLSQTTYDLVRDHVPAGTSLRNMGEHRLKDLGRPETIFQLLHPALRADFPPLRSLDNPELKHNLPQQVTTFVGRETQIAEVKALMARTRLLTLTGSGGAGKTRLALQVAADLLDAGGDGVWLVELAPLTDPNLVAPTVASVLGLKEEPGKPILQTLTEHLKPKNLLLLLDNCEHLLEICARLADAILRDCPRVLILATSREGLGISGETTYRVPSLSLPDPRQPQTPESLSRCEAVRLFVDRAIQVQTSFAVTGQNAPALASICRRLDGIPLALELAAARVRSLTVEDINQKLDQRFRLLTGGSRTALPRQQTLRSMIDWSYDLLGDAEKALLCRLSVFVDGWSLEAAESVCAGEPVEDGEVLDLLTSLADKSLVVSETAGASVRYRLLETVRQYARDRLLESGGGAEWRDRHLAHFLALVEEAPPHLRGDPQAWLEWLETEHDNLRAALEWATEGVGETPGDMGLRLANALWGFWYVRGHFGEGRERLARVLSASGEADGAIRAKVLNGAGLLAQSQSDFAAARGLFEESLALSREMGSQTGVAYALRYLGSLARDWGDHTAARGLYEESLALSRELGDRGNIASTLTNLGIVASSQNDFAAARALHEESLTLSREMGSRTGVAYALTNLGIVAQSQGDHAAAQGLYGEGLALYRELGHRVGIAYALRHLASLAQERGDHAAARGLYGESLVLYRELGDRGSIACGLAALAEVSPPLHAARLWGALEQLLEQIGAGLPPRKRPAYDHPAVAARAALGDDAAFDAAWAEGRAMTLEQAMGLAPSTPSPMERHR